MFWGRKKVWVKKHSEICRGIPLRIYSSDLRLTPFQNPDFRRSWGDCVARARGLAGGAWGMGEDFVQGV
jgi:hypothetical protein